MTVNTEALVGGSILAFWGLAMAVSGVAMHGLSVGCARPYRRRLPLMSKCGMTLSALCVTTMLLGFHFMGRT